MACFATAASLAGCTWDSSLYDDFVNKNTDSVMTCYGYCDIDKKEITKEILFKELRPGEFKVYKMI